MNQQDIYKKVEELLIKGKHQEIFKILKEYQPSNAVTLLETEFKDLQSKEIKGVLDSDQIQLKRNRINDKLLTLAKNGTPTDASTIKKNNLWKAIVPLVILILGGLFWWMNISDHAKISCPSYPTDIRNKVLIVPFVNIGDENAKPHYTLRDRINKVSKAMNLSIDAQFGEQNENLTMNQAPALASECKANVIIWGTFEKTDSLNIIYNYYFSNDPTKSISSELATLKNVSSIYKGEMSKSLEDAFFTICALIVMKDGNNALAKKWLENISHKEEIDHLLLKALN